MELFNRTVKPTPDTSRRTLDVTCQSPKDTQEENPRPFRVTHSR